MTLVEAAVTGRTHAPPAPRYTVETFVGSKFGAWARSERTWPSAAAATAAAQEIASAEKRDGLVIMKRRVVGV